MTEFNEEDLRFVASKYDKDRFDTRKAIAKFNERTSLEANRSRWWTTVVAVATSTAIAFGASIGIISIVNEKANENRQRQEVIVLNPDIATTHEFVYIDAPVADVLKELSAYYHCTLSTQQTDKHLTATFPDDDIDFIVSLIEKALSIDIIIEK